MKKYLFLLVSLLLFMFPVFAEENYNDWVGKEVVFLPKPASLASYGYMKYTYKKGTLKAIPYKDLANKSATIVSIENSSDTLDVVLKTEDGKTVYGTGYSGSLDDIGFKSELESAKQYINQVFQQSGLSKYPVRLYVNIANSDETKNVDVPKEEKLTVTSVEWGYYSHSPLRFTFKRENGDLVFWNGSFSRINDTSNQLLSPLNESWVAYDASKNSSTAPQKDYSNVKGDFKILVLGDLSETIQQKLDYLIGKGEATLKYSGYEFFYTMVFDSKVEGFLEYFQDKLYKISISFPKQTADHINTDIKSTIENSIKPMFLKLYGKPTNTYDFPTILTLQDGYMTSCYKWVLEKKTIYVGITADEFQYNAEIKIIDNGLNKAKQDFDKQEKQKSQEKSTSDF